ncbi:DUF6549 family protein [Chitinophaga sp. YIM B06452]|uniref:DUF6549 family protein n=1 Tax=Chitinophaga sp. YIM B06452 TaxID=3082158 RepID=UPI0031FEFF15
MKWDNIIIAGLLALVAFLAIRSCRGKEDIIGSLRDLQAIKEDSIRYWKDAAGTEHAERQVAEATLEAAEIVWRHELDSQAALLKVKKRHIQALATIGTTASGTVAPVVVTISQPGQPCTHQLQYDDRWLTLRGTVADTSTITYQVRDSLTLTTYRKKVGLFRYKTVVDAYSHNPSVRITGLSSLQIKTAELGRLGIGPYVGYGFDGRRWTPSVGISVHFSLIRL